MKFMLMMHAPRGTGEYQVNNWTPDDFKAHIAFMHNLNRDLKSAGEFAAAAKSSEVGRRRRARLLIVGWWRLTLRSSRVPAPWLALT